MNGVCLTVLVIFCTFI